MLFLLTETKNKTITFLSDRNKAEIKKRKKRNAAKWSKIVLEVIKLLKLKQKLWKWQKCISGLLVKQINTIIVNK